MSEEWIQLGETAILEVLQAHTAVTVRELEARLSNRDWPGPGGIHVDPDFLSEARRRLAAKGLVGFTTARTRGNADPITTYHLAGQRNTTRVAEVAARKRLLTARHSGWSNATRRRPKGLIGEAGERVLCHVLEESDRQSDVVRDASSALGHTIQGGTFDSRSYLTVERNGQPEVFTIVTEIKNQREWMYPTNPQIHKFLYKAANLSNATRNPRIVPVFVSSFRSSQAYQFGRLLGFFAVQSEHQWVLDRHPVSEDPFYEVREELGYADLRLGADPTVRFTRALTESLERNVFDLADRWAMTASLCEDLFDSARLLKDPTELGSFVARITARVRNELGAPPAYEPIVGPRN